MINSVSMSSVAPSNSRMKVSSTPNYFAKSNSADSFSKSDVSFGLKLPVKQIAIGIGVVATAAGGIFGFNAYKQGQVDSQINAARNLCASVGNPEPNCHLFNLENSITSQEAGIAAQEQALKAAKQQLENDKGLLPTVKQDLLNLLNPTPVPSATPQSSVIKKGSEAVAATLRNEKPFSVRAQNTMVKVAKRAVARYA